MSYLCFYSFSFRSKYIQVFLKYQNKKMENTTISERILQMIDFLQVSTNDFAKKIGYSRSQAIYHVINGANKFTPNLIDKIIKRFPEVHYWYLVKGKLPIILDNPKLKQNQANLFNSAILKDGIDYSLESFLTLKNIEKAINDQNDLTRELIDFLKQKKADH